MLQAVFIKTDSTLYVTEPSVQKPNNKAIQQKNFLSASTSEMSPELKVPSAALSEINKSTKTSRARQDGRMTHCNDFLELPSRGHSAEPLLSQKGKVSRPLFRITSQLTASQSKVLKWTSRGHFVQEGDTMLKEAFPQPSSTCLESLIFSSIGVMPVAKCKEARMPCPSATMYPETKGTEGRWNQTKRQSRRGQASRMDLQ